MAVPGGGSLVVLRRSATAVVGQGGLNFDLLTQQCVERNPGPMPMEEIFAAQLPKQWRIRPWRMLQRAGVCPIRRDARLLHRRAALAEP